MTTRKALSIARTVAADAATVNVHHGLTKRDRAIRITGCWPEEAKTVGVQIAERIGGTLRADAGFVAVWY